MCELNQSGVLLMFQKNENGVVKHLASGQSQDYCSLWRTQVVSSGTYWVKSPAPPEALV